MMSYLWILLLGSLLTASVHAQDDAAQMEETAAPEVPATVNAPNAGEPDADTEVGEKTEEVKPETEPNADPELEADKPNGDLGVEDSGAEVPAETGAEVPADTGAEVPVSTDTGAEVPADTGAEVPPDAGAEVPTDTGAEVPASTDTGAEVPADTGAEVPASTDTGAEVPADTGAEVPVDTGVEVPVDTGVEVPVDTGAEVPAETGAEVPADTGAEVPVDTSADVPADTGAEVPASTDTGAEVPADEDTDATKLQKESDRKEEADATGQDGAQAGTEVKADDDGVSAPDTSGSDIKEPVEPKNPGSEMIVPEIRRGVNAAVPADEGFNLEDALAAGVDDSSQAGKSSNLETGARAAGATGDAETPEGKEAGSGPLAGVLTAIIVAAIGAVAGYFTYQQKKLCFKSRQEADPEAARKADPAEAQSEPQVLSNLLNSS